MNMFFAVFQGVQGEMVAGVARLTAGALIAGLWQGVLLSVAAGMLMRALPKSTAALRFVVWAAVFCASVAMPFANLPGAAFAPHGGVAAVSHVIFDMRWSYVLSGLWLVAAAYRLVQLGLQGLALRALWKSAVPVASEKLAGLEATLVAGSREVELCTSDMVDRPSVIGFFAPRILIPSWLFEQLTAVELNHIVLHEMEHLRRRDDWVNLLQKVGLVLLPLNPALFWIDRRLSTERELACDDGVLERTKMPRAYAASLASIAEMRLERRMHRRVVALALGVLGVAGILRGRSEFGRRIERILGPRAVMSPMMAGAVAAALLVMVMGAGVGLARAPQLVSFAPAGGAQSVAAVSGVSTGGVIDGGGLAAGTGIREVSFHAPGAKSSANLVVSSKSVPQRLKPRGDGGVYGTAEAVPLSKTVISRNSDDSSRERSTSGAKAHIETIDFTARAEALAYPKAETQPMVKSEPKPMVKSEPKPVAKSEPKPVAKSVTRPVVKSVAQPVARAQWTVLTSFDEDAPAQVVMRMPDGRFYVVPYAAVPVRDGWLIVQL